MRIPFLASASDAGRNIGKSFMAGFSPGKAGMPFHAKSIGGLTTLGGLSAAGAIGGAAASTITTKDDTGKMAMGGAAVGAVALPAVGLASKGIYSGAKSIGKSAKAIGIEGMKAQAAAVGQAATNGAAAVSRAATGVFSHAPVVGKLGTSVAGLAGMAVDFDHMKNATSILDSVRLTNPISGFKAGWKAGKGAGKLGHGIAGGLINGESLLLGGAIVSGAAGAIGEIEKQKMGTMSGYTTNTPTINKIDADYGRGVPNAGDDGSLTFAMSRLGRNGY